MRKKSRLDRAGKTAEKKMNKIVREAKAKARKSGLI
jgi:hypothetical protein